MNVFWRGDVGGVWGLFWGVRMGGLSWGIAVRVSLVDIKAHLFINQGIKECSYLFK